MSPIIAFWRFNIIFIAIISIHLYGVFCRSKHSSKSYSTLCQTQTSGYTYCDRKMYSSCIMISGLTQCLSSLDMIDIQWHRMYWSKKNYRLIIVTAVTLSLHTQVHILSRNAVIKAFDNKKYGAVLKSS